MFLTAKDDRIARFIESGCSGLRTAQKTLSQMVSGLAGNAAGQRMGLALGTQDSFSWTKLAASGLGGVLGGRGDGGFDPKSTPCRGAICGSAEVQHVVGTFECAEYGRRWFGRRGRECDGSVGGVCRGETVGASVGMELGRVRLERGDRRGVGSRIGMQGWKSKACFAAGTPLWWEGGSKPIEQFVVGEQVWSRDEFDPHGPLELKLIEAIFVRTAPILVLRVDGREIRTTGEHPFYAKDKAWTAAAALLTAI